MHFIDYFSGSIRNDTFFQKKSKGTIFGIFLSLIYFIFFAFVSFFYIIDYSLNDKYEIQSLSIINMTTMEEIEKMNEDPDLNPELDFFFELVDDNNEYLSERFKLYEKSSNQFLEKVEDNFYHIRTRVSNLNLYVVYFCDFNECLIEEEDNGKLYLFLRIYYKSFDLTHQNDTYPLQRLHDDSYFLKNIPFHLGYPSKTYLFWKNIKYKEQKDISMFFNFMNPKTEYIAGYIDSYREIFMENNPSIILGNNSKSLIASFSMVNDFHEYIEYTRRKKGKLDILAKITALVSLMKVILINIYEYFLNNYKNYIIIKNFFHKKLKINFNESKTDTYYEMKELDNFDIINDNALNRNKNKKIIDLTKEYPLINKINIKKESTINKYNNNCGNENENNTIINEFNDLNCFCYYVNYIFCKNSMRFKKKEKLISLCNDILYNYMSIDSILYNQIILENLFKDYEWKNPYLNRIESNELINKFNYIIK